MVTMKMLPIHEATRKAQGHLADLMNSIKFLLDDGEQRDEIVRHWEATSEALQAILVEAVREKNSGAQELFPGYE